MSAPHFFLDAIGSDELVIDGAEAHHAVRSLRIRAGETITIADGLGRVAVARVLAAEGGRAPILRATVLQRRVEREELPALVMYPAIPKSGKLDLVVQKLTEIGVEEIRPWHAARSVPRWDAAKALAQTERLRAIAREAAKQSRRAFLPVVAPPGPPEDLPDPTFVLHEESHARLRALLPPEPPDRVGLVIGPEGGLAPEEIDGLARAGAIVAGLGPRVLRTETAALAAATLIFGIFGKIG